MGILKILQAHILFSYPNFLITVAVETGVNSFTCYYRKTTAISEKDLQDTLKKGKRLSVEKARELFFLPEYKYEEGS